MFGSVWTFCPFCEVMIALFSWSECEMEEFLWSLAAGGQWMFWHQILKVKLWDPHQSKVTEPVEDPSIPAWYWYSRKHWGGKINTHVCKSRVHFSKLQKLDQPLSGWYLRYLRKRAFQHTLAFEKIFGQFASGFGKISKATPPWHSVKYQLVDPYFMAYYASYIVFYRIG